MNGLDPATLVYLLGAIALGCYVQTVTGFAFGLIFMAVVSIGQFLDLVSASLIVTIIAIINSSFALKKAQRHTDWKLVGSTISLAIPMVAVGYWLLTHLSQNDVSTLRIILGCVIISASLVLIFPPKKGKAVSSLPVFALFGALGGLLSGLFSTSGPPLVFQFYRQNLPLTVIRDSLLAFFTLSASIRLIVALSLDGLPQTVWMTCLIGFPVTLGATWLGKHYPPKINDITLRRFVAFLLFLTGGNLVFG